jgi:hypothetical protein
VQPEVYDPARDTIFVSEPETTATPAELNSYDIEPGPRPGTAVLRVPGRAARAKGVHLFASTVITAKQANGIRKGTYMIAFKAGPTGPVKPIVTVIPASSVPKPPPSSKDDSSDVDPTSSGFRGQILALLRSREARVVGHRTLAGQDTIEIASADGHTTYFVDPGTYRPVELRTRGTDGGTALRFSTYETLDPTRTAACSASRRSTRPHGSIATPPTNRAADARLFPNG